MQMLERQDTDRTGLNQRRLHRASGVCTKERAPSMRRRPTASAASERGQTVALRSSSSCSDVTDESSFRLAVPSNNGCGPTPLCRLRSHRASLTPDVDRAPSTRRSASKRERASMGSPPPCQQQAVEAPVTTTAAAVVLAPASAAVATAAEMAAEAAVMAASSTAAAHLITIERAPAVTAVAPTAEMAADAAMPAPSTTAARLTTIERVSALHVDPRAGIALQVRSYCVVPRGFAGHPRPWYHGWNLLPGGYTLSSLRRTQLNSRAPLSSCNGVSPPPTRLFHSPVAAPPVLQRQRGRDGAARAVGFSHH